MQALQTIINPLDHSNVTNNRNKGQESVRSLNHPIGVELHTLPKYEFLYIFFIQGCLFKIKDERIRASGLLVDLMKT